MQSPPPGTRNEEDGIKGGDRGDDRRVHDSLRNAPARRVSCQARLSLRR